MIAHAADGDVRRRRAAREGAGLAGAGGHGPREGGVDRDALRLGRRRLAAGPGYDDGSLRCGRGWGRAYPQRRSSDSPPRPLRKRRGGRHVVAIDYGSKRNIFRNLVAAGARVTVVPATATFDEVMALKPDGIFLSNGPGDPAATGDYAVPVIRQLLETGKPLFGICLGHQLLGAGGRRDDRPRCSRAIAAPTIRSSGWRTARSRSPA